MPEEDRGDRHQDRQVEQGGTAQSAGEVRANHAQLEADRAAEAVLLEVGGGRGDAAGRAVAAEHDRYQEGAGRRPRGFAAGLRCGVQEDVLVRRLRDAAEEVLELQDRSAEHRAGAEGRT